MSLCLLMQMSYDECMLTYTDEFMLTYTDEL